MVAYNILYARINLVMNLNRAEYLIYVSETEAPLCHYKDNNYYVLH